MMKLIRDFERFFSSQAVFMFAGYSTGHDGIPQKMLSLTEFFEVHSVPHNYIPARILKRNIHAKTGNIHSLVTLVSYDLSSNSAPIQTPRFVGLNRNCRRVGINKCHSFSKTLSCSWTNHEPK